MTRREFLEIGAMAAALAGAGRLPLLGQGVVGAATPAPVCVQPIVGYLTRFSPTVSRRLGEEYRLVYDIIHWNRTDPRTWQTTNDVAGTLEIARTLSPNGPKYRIAQETTYIGVTNRLAATVTCDDNNLNSIRQWHVGWSALADGKPIADMHLSDRGSVRNGVLRMGRRRAVQLGQALASQWTLLDFVGRRARGDTGVTFDLLEDLSLLKEGQHLVAAGLVRIPCASGPLTLRSFLQTGEGIHPRHYLVDDNGLPQVVTASMVSWALQSVE